MNTNQPKKISEVLENGKQALLQNSGQSEPKAWEQVLIHARRIKIGETSLNSNAPVFALKRTEKKALSQCFATEQAQHYAGMMLSDFDTKIFKTEREVYNDYQVVLKLITGYLRNWKSMKAEGAGLYFWSNSAGSGKTMLASVIANELHRKHGVTSQIMTMATIFRMLKEAFNPANSYSEDRVMNVIRHIPLLIIDEIGFEAKESDWKRDMVYEIVDLRYNMRKPVLFTSNLPIEDLPYHVRVRSRIKEMAVEVDFPDFDYRNVKGDRREQELLSKILE